MKMRVDAFAEQLGVNPSELLKVCSEIGFDAPSSTSEIDVDELKAAIASAAEREREASSSRNEAPPPTKACPYCGESILEVAVKCRHCGEFLDGRSAAPAAAPAPVPQEARPANLMDPSQPTFALATTVAAGAALVVGSFLPWAKLTAPFVGQLSKSGMDGGDGFLSLVLGGVAIALGLAGLGSRRAHAPYVFGLVGLGAVALAALELADLNSKFADVRAQSDLVGTSVGPGIWMIGIAGVWLIGSAIRLQRARRLAGVSADGSKRATPSDLRVLVAHLSRTGVSHDEAVSRLRAAAKNDPELLRKAARGGGTVFVSRRELRHAKALLEAAAEP